MSEVTGEIQLTKPGRGLTREQAAMLMPRPSTEQPCVTYYERNTVTDRADLTAQAAVAQEAVAELQRTLDNLTTAPVERAEGVTVLAQLEATIVNVMDLLKEAGAEVSPKQAERLHGWTMPLDSLRSDVRRMRGQIEGPLKEVKYA